MSPMGRPKVDNPKSLRISVCLDADTMRALEEYCEEHGISKGEAIRRGVVLLTREK